MCCTRVDSVKCFHINAVDVGDWAIPRRCHQMRPAGIICSGHIHSTTRAPRAHKRVRGFLTLSRCCMFLPPPAAWVGWGACG